MVTMNSCIKLLLSLTIVVSFPLDIKYTDFEGSVAAQVAPSRRCVNNESLDIIFVWDGSSSISSRNFNTTAAFLTMLVNNAPGAKFAAIQYAGRARVEFDFNDFPTAAAVIHGISAVQQIGGGTRTGYALEFLSNNLLSAYSGNRAASADLVIVLTDGKSSDNPGPVAQDLISRGLRVLAVGVGSADVGQLNSMVADISTDVFVVRNFAGLNAALSHAIMKEVECPTTTPPPTTTTTTTTTTPAPTTTTTVATTTTIVQDVCDIPVDAIFVIDGSGSINSADFTKQLEFLAMTVQNLPDTSKVALVQFSTDAQLEFSFNDNADKASIIAAILAVDQIGGGTRIDIALDFVDANLLGAASGNRADFADLVFVFTDGVSQGDPTNAANNLRPKVSAILAVGVGNADTQQLLNIAGDPSLVFEIDNFDMLNEDFLRLLMQASCPNEMCDIPVDAIFVIDGSGSINSEDFTKQLEFLAMTVQNLPDTSKVALVQFSTGAQLEFSFNDNADKASIIAAILAVDQIGGGTRIDIALDFVDANLLGAASGNRADFADLVFVFTDGVSQGDPTNAANNLRPKVAAILAVGVGNADYDQLLNIAGNPDLVFEIDNFDMLNEAFLRRLMEASCPNEMCDVPVDAIFVIDGSGSINSADFTKQLEFLAMTVQNLPDTSKVALVQFSTDAQLEFSFNDNADKASIIAAILAVDQIGGGTRIDIALDFVDANLLDVASGNRATFPDLVFVFTDGVSQGDPTNAANNLRPKVAAILAVGVGNADYDQLLNIAGEPDLVFEVDNFDMLNEDFLRRLMQVSCPEEPEICTATVDFIVVVDGSGSISSADFAKQLEFVVMIIENGTEIVAAGAKLALVQFSDNPRLEFSFNDNPDVAAVIAAIRAVQQLGGGTRIDRALDFVDANLLSASSGNRPDVADLVFLFTDGKSGGDPTNAANNLRPKVDGILAVGVGNDADYDQLEDITGDPSFVVMLDNYGMLGEDLLELLMQIGCPEMNPCEGSSDLMFLLDGSGSVRPADFQKSLEFIVMTIESSNQLVNFALVQFATSVREEFRFASFNTRDEIVAAVLAISQLGGGTRIDRGLDFIRDNLLSVASGNRVDASNIVLLFTDGVSTGNPVTSGEALRQAGVDILAVGIGNADIAQLIAITADATKVFEVDNFDELNDELLRRLMNVACNQPDFTCENLPNGFYPNPFFPCNGVFFMCNDGQRIKKYCDQGLVFDVDAANAGSNLVCVNPEYVIACGGTPTLPPVGSTLPPIDFECENRPNGDYENSEEACSFFYVTCSNGITYVNRCPASLMFDALSGSCQQKQFTQGCGGNPPPSPSAPDIPLVPEEEFSCVLREDGNYPRSEECADEYYTCSGGVGYYRSCPAGLFYDNLSGLCLRQEFVVSCGGKVTEPAVVVTFAPTEPPFTFSCVGKENGGYSNPEDLCSPIYAVCSNNITAFLTCPGDLDYDVTSQSCLRRQFIDVCGGEPTESTNPPPISTQIPLFPFSCVDREDGSYANPEGNGCAPEYAVCSNGVVYWLTCGSNLLAFDIISGDCLEPAFVEACGGIATSKAPPVTAPPPPFEFNCVGLSGYFSDPRDECSSFYVVCSNNISYILTCPNQLKFDLTTELCLQGIYVSMCGGLPTESVPISTTIREPIDFDCPVVNSGNGYYGDPEQECSDIFYSCVGNVAYRLNCPRGLFYDQISHECLRGQYVVDCGGESTTKGTTSGAGLNTGTPAEFDCWELADGNYPAPNAQCADYFYRCVDRTTFRVRCPVELPIFSPVQLLCVAEISGC